MDNILKKIQTRNVQNREYFVRELRRATNLQVWSLCVCVFRAEAGSEVLPLLLTRYRQHTRNCLLTYTN